MKRVTTMHHRVLLFAVLAAVIALSGCGSTPNHRYASAADMYASTMDVLTHMKGQGQLDEETIDKVDLYAPLGRDALEAWKNSLQAGDAPDQAINRFNGVIINLLKTLREAESEESTPTQEDAQ